MRHFEFIDFSVYVTLFFYWLITWPLVMHCVVASMYYKSIWVIFITNQIW